MKECISVINETMKNNKDNITDNNTYLIGFIYYCRRSNFDRKKIKRFYLSKNFDLLNYKNGYIFIINKRQN